MNDELFELWTYLSARPLTGLTITLVAYFAATSLHRRVGRPALLNPVLGAIVMLALLLTLTGVPYARYFEGAQFVHFLLGPATVALAVPLHRNLAQVRRVAPAVGAGVIGGGLLASGLSVFFAAAFGGAGPVLRSVAPKSVTTPVAMALSEGQGGLPSLTAVLVVLTALVGTVVGGPLLDLARIRSPEARGLAYGVHAHGLGTAHAFGEGPLTGSFASLGMGLNALMTSIWLPPLAALLTSPQ